jgi:hypothetical protein
VSAHSRTKGNRFELEIVHQLRDLGLAAEKISGIYRPGEDISCPVLNVDRLLQCKRRARAFGTLYAFLDGAYAAVIRDDRSSAMVVMRLEDWAQLALGTGGSNG